MRPAHGSLAAIAALTLLLGDGAGAADAQPDPAPAAAPAVATADHTVTLVTGDRVVFGRSPAGGYQVSVDPLARSGFDGTFQSIDDGEQLYVLPSDALPLIPDQLDRELFNVTKLAEQGLVDGVPVITTGQVEPRVGVSAATELSAIDGYATTVDDSGAWWRAVRSEPAAAGRVWLDERVEVALADSGPLIGAPRAWEAGFDGTGVTVAVLDTGIDVDHPDLAGKVIESENFTESTTDLDRHGHGTHVAGIIAGSGEASDGEFAGIAPGVELLNVKVMGDNGSGAESDIIAGMAWAASAGADVINMSLGGPASDGTDPISQAVNQLTEQHDVLFAIAAGNTGPADHSVTGPGAASAALTVGSVDKQEQLAGDSGRGPRAGDFAVKPDITAPGVGIVAAKGEGTELGSPVGEQYTQLSGTSMAAPHAAAAAAILRQAEPDLTAAEVKARLVGTAVPNPTLDVYQQGGGRIDVPAALAAPVQVAQAPIDLGRHRFPHEGAEPVTAEVSYINRTGAPVELALDLEVSSRDGAVPPPAMLSVEPATLTIEPGGTAAATVTLDVSAGDPGIYGGYLVATTGGTAVRTSVGFYKEDSTFELTVIGIARDGRLASGASTLAVLDVEDMSRFMQPGNGFVDGVFQTRVPAGTYAVLGSIHTFDEHNQDIQQTAFVGDPELTVTEDTTVVLDAREANPITVETPDHVTDPQGQVGLGYWRTAAQPGPMLGLAFLGLHAGREFFATPTEPVTLGGFEFYSRWRLAAPEAELAVTAPTGLTLDPVLMRAPAVDGEHTLRLVDVGAGAAEDYEGVDVTGAAVLVERGPVPPVEQEQHAAAAGAAVLIITNDVPGRLVGSLSEEPGSIPTLSLTQAEGQAVRAILQSGETTVRVSGTRWSPYLYDLVLVEADRIPEDLSYVVPSDDLAELRVRYHHDAIGGHPMAEARHFSRPFHSSSAYLHPYIEGPRERTEYLIGGDAMSYQQTVFGELPFEARLQEPAYTFYPPASEVTKRWFQQVIRPALLPEVGQTTRTGDTLQLVAYEWVDSDGNHFPELFGLAPYPGDTIAVRLLRDGELVAEADKPRGEFPMAAEPAEYRVELDVTREADWWQRSVATRTAWTFQSGPTNGTQVLPLLSIDYLAELDLSNTLVGSELTLRVSQQPADLPAIAGAELSLSFDDGASWQPVPVTATGDGEFQAVLPEPGTHNGFASVRVEAWDADDNRIEQEVIRAWRLPTG
ncbi:MAG TPA: S8 family serine peptidase [Natronosporangium sp.]